ncbi:CAP domain-containing protein [Ruegeria arenilitoris]|uniref:CAP domain-containing protein n=1 Tax=Ruegeria arenilitoris TaxID=1173585 RepID=UPI0014816A0C|nr:CAP domain-containing protein [Ruegeria arenilitoris]
MSTASNLERQMLALINDERTSRGLQPLKLELQLNDSAEDHSEWMLQTDIFSHTGQGGSSATQRMRDAGFDFTGSWRSGENIAWQSERGAAGASDDVVQLHQSLMNSPGHRANILNPDFEYIGIGIEEGNFNGWDAVIVTQNFATTSAPVQLDTGGSGGGSGGDTPTQPGQQAVDAGTVGDASDNWFILKAGQAGALNGGDGDDILDGGFGRDTLTGGTGDDTLSGHGGNDVLLGGQGGDLLMGATGNDWLQSGMGADRLQGGSGNDVLRGGRGRDTLIGGDDDDTLIGARGIDTMTGGNGADTFVFTIGPDTVTDFTSEDFIDLSLNGAITGYSDLMNNHISQSGNDVIIDDNAGNTLTLQNTQIADLANEHFMF